MAYTDYQRITPEGYIRVVNSADYDPIISYTPLPDITVFVDAIVNLPNAVQATFKSGKLETMIVKWEVSSVNTSVAGTQKIYGDIGGGAAVVLQNVIVEQQLTDLDILRQIRDANPTSQLPTLWLDSEDPYTQWEGVTWNVEKTRVVELRITQRNVSTVEGVNLLSELTFISCYNNQLLTAINTTGLVKLETFDCTANKIVSLDFTSNVALRIIRCQVNNLSTMTIGNLPLLVEFQCFLNSIDTIPTLTAKGVITSYNFTYNRFSTSELDRFRAMGFTIESKLLPQNT